MLKLWLVVYSGVQIVGSAGPLPYGMDECIIRRDLLRTSQQEVLSTGYSQSLKRALTGEEMDKIRDMAFECEWRDKRPVIGSIERS